MRNKALSKCRLLQKNCKKILWHKDGAVRREADFSWERCSAFPPPDVYSYGLLPSCHRGGTAPLAGQCGSARLGPLFLLFKLFLSESLGQAPILPPLPVLQLSTSPDCSNGGRRDAYLAFCVINLWLGRRAAYFLSTQFPPTNMLVLICL